MLKPIFAGCLALCCISARAQLLFTYGGDSVTVPQFLTAYTKNNTGSNNKEALGNYLDLYIASRLKIKEAKTRGYDTLPQLTADLASLREQILPSYLKDEASMKKLVQEAAQRAAKDIHLYTIFISAEKDGLPDTAAARQRANEVLKKLQAGADFATLAKEVSDDPSAKENGGDAGYITVFTLPYAIENLVYKTPAGSLTSLYVSKKGYHIFKNAGERPALGSIKAAQILIAFPPEANATEKAAAKKRADSIYNAVLKGADFGKLATRYSNDVTSAEANGQLPTFGVGEYNAVFENVVFGLSKNGAVSKPFLTGYGYHIVKRLERLPPPTDATSEKALQALQSKIESSDRMESMQQTLAQTILKQASFKKQNINEPLLWAYSDSVLQGGAAPAAAPFTDSTVLFTIGDKNATVAEWIVHAQTFRYKPDGSGLKPYPQLWDEFVQATALNFYKEHLEQYNDAFRQQLDEFKDGNLFFEIMQREVWNKAQEDTVALEHFYKAHAASYTWKQSADAVIFYAADVATAKQLRAALVKKSAAWKTLVSNLSEKVAADSARFELSQIPNRTKQALLPGVVTTPVVNAADSTASFALLLKVYTTAAPRSFAEAKGLVVSDYQAALERDWITELKKKYPVVLNEKELAKL